MGILAIGVIFLTIRKNNSITTSQNSQQQSTTSSPQISTGPIPDIPLNLPSGYVIHIFASGLGNPRVLTFSPGGVLLVSDPINNTVTALLDPNHTGVAQSTKVVIDQGNHLHGLAFYNNQLFVANVDNLTRYNWDENTLTATFDKVLFSLPENNDHNNRTLTFDSKGIMYISVGSTCNVCIENNPLDATVSTSDANGSLPQVFATGLRNAAFTTINPISGELWATGMGRDYLGDNLPPDEINIIKKGGNYGWPYCYGDKIVDRTFYTASGDPCTNTIAPIYEIKAHSAPLGLVFINSPQFPTEWQNDLLVAYHGSWNRTVPDGYKVVHMKVQGNTISSVDDFLSGFLQNGVGLGRPVDLIFDSLGNLYISDDKTGNVYIVQKS